MGTITENDDAASDLLMVLLSSFLDPSFLDSQDPEPQASDITTLSLQLPARASPSAAEYE